jgi:hypothetical protein
MGKSCNGCRCVSVEIKHTSRCRSSVGCIFVQVSNNSSPGFANRLLFSRRRPLQTSTPSLPMNTPIHTHAASTHLHTTNSIPPNGPRHAKQQRSRAKNSGGSCVHANRPKNRRHASLSMHNAIDGHWPANALSWCNTYPARQQAVASAAKAAFMQVFA